MRQQAGAWSWDTWVCLIELPSTCSFGTPELRLGSSNKATAVSEHVHDHANVHVDVHVIVDVIGFSSDGPRVAWPEGPRCGLLPQYKALGA